MSGNYCREDIAATELDVSLSENRGIESEIDFHASISNSKASTLRGTASLRFEMSRIREFIDVSKVRASFSCWSDDTQSLQ